MKGEQQQIKRASKQIGTQIAGVTREKAREALNKIARKGTTPKDVLGLTDDMIEGIYGQAYNLYNTGKYLQAIEVFRMLLMIAPTEAKYSMGLGACFHMLKEYKNAINAYGVLVVMDPRSPVGFYHMSDCFIQMGNPVSAVIALESAIKRSEGKPEFAVLKDRSLLTIESLKKEIKEGKFT